jgi:omega-6 fatty acid desaturase (delta-12 desaturase)
MKNQNWLSRLRQFEKSDFKKSILQIITSFVPYLALITIMIMMISRGYPYWIILLLSVFAAGFFVRIFIILHDCAHNSFFTSKRACTTLGTICSIFTFMPFTEFQHSHSIHHSNAGKLDKRGIGDVWTMTKDEYSSSGMLTKLAYRTFRNPFILFIFGPLFLVIITSRLPSKSSGKKEIYSIIFIDVIMLASIIIAYFTVGIWNYVLVIAPVVFIAEDIGIWLFFVQHQFEDVYWSKGKEWDPVKAALEGSSYIKLPKILQWFTGNIGFHHIHHLRPRIPNYKLIKCYNEVQEVQKVNKITLIEGIKAMSLRLFDEKSRKLVKFTAAKI